MRNWKSLVGALLLTVLLIGLAFLNGAELSGAMPEIGDAQISYAATAKFPEIRIKKPVRNDEGDLIGCIGKGNGCVIVVMYAGGREHQILFSDGDVLLR